MSEAYRNPLKYDIGTKVMFSEDDKEVYYVYNHQCWKSEFTVEETYTFRYILRRLSDDHQVSMVNEKSIKSLVDIRDDKISNLVDE